MGKMGSFERSIWEKIPAGVYACANERGEKLEVLYELKPESFVANKLWAGINRDGHVVLQCEISETTLDPDDARLLGHWLISCYSIHC